MLIKQEILLGKGTWVESVGLPGLAGGPDLGFGFP